jgi:TonB family protein
MSELPRQLLLDLYAGDSHKGPDRDFFLPILLLTFVLAGSLGWYLKVNNPPPESIQEKISRMETSFIIEEKPRVVEKTKEPPKKPAKKNIPVKKKKPIDLTEKSLLNQKQDDSVKETVEKPRKKVRRVYGLKRVYSTGIGASGSAADAVIGKVGNTLNAEIDTFTATEEELRGTLVSVTKITSMPKLKKTVKPEYTKEMLANKIEGTVRVKVLVDIDGKVKKAIVLDDLGYGSKAKALEACQNLLFEPARIGKEPRATWIIVTFRFAMLD